MGFLQVELFRSFRLKIGSNVHFDAFILENFVVLQKNGKLHLIFCCKNKYINKFHAFTIRTDNKNVSEIEELRWENGSKSAQNVRFFIDLSKNHYLQRKTRNVILFFIIKNRNVFQFVFKIINDFRNMSERGEFKFENSLKKNRQKIEIKLRRIKEITTYQASVPQNEVELVEYFKSTVTSCTESMR